MRRPPKLNFNHPTPPLFQTVRFEEIVGDFHVHKRVEHLSLGGDNVLVLEKWRIVEPEIVRYDGEEAIGGVENERRGVRRRGINYLLWREESRKIKGG